MSEKRTLRKQDNFSLGIEPFYIGTVLIALIYVVGVLYMTNRTIDRNEEDSYRETEAALQIVLETTNEALGLWLLQQRENILHAVVEQSVIDSTQQLLEVSRTKEALLAHPTMDLLREHFQPLLEHRGDLGIFIIAPDYITLASMRDENVGTLNLIAEQRPDLLARVFQGETLLIPPVHSDVELPDDSGELYKNHLPTMFVASPIRDAQDQIVAALTIRIDPGADFSRITQLGRIGTSGESYAVGKDGIMMTESRFTDQLVEINLLQEGEKSINNIRVADPGGNLLEGFELPSRLEELPLTVMSTSVLAKNRGVSMVGYRDYRGVPVFGTWLWNEALGVGLTTEIDVDEALRPFYRTRESLVLLNHSTMAVSLVLAIALLYFRWRHTQDIEKTYLALQESDEQIRAILEHILDGIISINRDGLIISFNPAVEKIFGYAAEEVLGKNVKMLMPDPYYSEHDTYLDNYYRTGVRKIIGLGREVTGLRKDGSTFPMFLGVSEFETAGERAFTSVIRDISPQKEFEQTLQQAKNASESASLVKSEFLSNVSHELRTPLSSLMGVAFQIEQMELSPHELELLDKMKSATGSLKAIIDTVLDFSHLRDGELEFFSIPFKPRDLLAELVEIVTPKTYEKGVKLISYTAPDVPNSVNGDSERLGQALLNLIDNAIKFTEEGEIEVSINLEPGDDNEETVVLRFEVRDTGIGMTEEEIFKIFLPFTQVDSSSTRRYGGLGMGLIISKQIVTKMGGEIQVESQPGEGSSFYFTVKLGRITDDEGMVASISVADAEKPEKESILQPEEGSPLDLDELHLIIQELAHHLEENDTLAKNTMQKLGKTITWPKLQPDLQHLEKLIALYKFEDARESLTLFADEIGITLGEGNDHDTN